MAVVVSHALALLVLVSACFFPTAETCTGITSKHKSHLQPLSPEGYRVYIVFLAPPTGGGDDMDYAAHRAWHGSFLPTETTRDGQPRLRASYTLVGNGFSTLLTDDEAKHLADKQGVIRIIPNRVRYPQTTHNYGRRRSTLE